MLDVVDFIAERGGDPKKIRESQRLRNAPESAVDEVIKLYEEHRAGEMPPPRQDSTAT
jgi:seryl-tRNA synthetase